MRNCARNAITKCHPSDKIKLYQHIQHKFNTNNKIWPKLTKFLPKLLTQIKHKFNTRFTYVTVLLFKINMQTA